MNKPNLDNILITKLSQFPLTSGNVLHGIKKGDVGYSGFGEVYFSIINPGAVKAWKLHRQMTSNLIVPFGEVRFVFCNPDVSGSYRVEKIGQKNYVRLTVPPNIWFGFQGLGTKPSLITNIANLKHSVNEVETADVTKFCYMW